MLWGLNLCPTDILFPLLFEYEAKSHNEIKVQKCITTCSYFHCQASLLLPYLHTQNQRGEGCEKGVSPPLSSSWLLPAPWPWDAREFLQSSGRAKHLGILRKREKCGATSLRRQLCEDQIARDVGFSFQLLQLNPIHRSYQYTSPNPWPQQKCQQ